MADAQAAGDRDLVRKAVDCARAGASIVQLRAKHIDTRSFLDLGRELVRQLRPLRVPLIINDRVDVALSCRAGGVHLGQDDLPLREARRLLGAGRVIGLSVSSAEEARRAQAQGADYLGVGPVFPTASKETLTEPLGLEGLRAIRSAVRLPLLAIGGISAGNAAEVMKAGADGVAVISAVLGAPDAARAVAELLAAVAHGQPGL